MRILFILLFCLTIFVGHAYTDQQKAVVGGFLPDTPIVCKQSFSRFLGTAQKANVQFVYGVDIKPIGANTFSYTLTTVRNWKKTTTLSGVALLEEAYSGKRMMPGVKAGSLIPCYRFFDKKNMVVLYISKGDNPSHLLASVNRISGDRERIVTPMMHSK